MSKTRQFYLLIVGGVIFGAVAYTETNSSLRIGLGLVAAICFISGIWLWAKNNFHTT